MATTHDNDIQRPLLGQNGLADDQVSAFDRPKQVWVEDADEDAFLQDAAVQGLGGKLRIEINRLLALALPLAGQNILAYSLSLISVGFIGHLGKYELSVAVLATSLYNLTGNSVIQGMAGGMETLCGQAFGAGSYKQVGIVLQRALAILSLIAAVVVSVWSQAGPLLLALGQSEELAAGAARYIHIISPALWMLVVCECLKRYLMTQGVVHPPLVITCIVTALSPLYNWFFIHYLQWHLDGAAIAFDAQMATIAGSLLTYVIVRDTYLQGKPDQTWHGLSKEAFIGWGQYLGLALPSCGMVCLEWWIFEAVILLAGRLPDPEVSVSVMGICMNIISCIYMVPLGLGAATSTRISNYLGASFPENAKLCARVAISMCFFITVVTCTAVIASRDVLAYLFTSDAQVVHHTAKVLPILAAALLGDAILATLAGVLRGCGRQVVGALMNAVAYWGIGFPLAYALAFDYHLGTRGLWMGLATVTTLQSFVIGGYVASIQWEKEADAAMDRVLTLSGYVPGVATVDEEGEGEEERGRGGGERGGVGETQQQQQHHMMVQQRGWNATRSQPMPSMLGTGSVGAHPLNFSYGSFQTRPLANSFGGPTSFGGGGSHSHTHRVLGVATNASTHDLEAAARAVQGIHGRGGVIVGSHDGGVIVGSRQSHES